ncbi:MAG: LytTR family DNA-binding domain-containing protein [Eubacteriales bacterium]|nr:LytTR family DNA-binding domain-containing protein [Eubacteriales bacterium]
MLRIGICDDVSDARLSVRWALERILDRRRMEGRIFEFSSGEGLLRWMQAHTGEVDLLFLDMEMADLDGMETARRLRAVQSCLQIVFLTGHAEHVFDGYAVGALGYLLKPAREQQLEEVLDRCLAAMCREEKVFLCRSGETLYRIPQQSILYFQSDRRQVLCVTAQRTYTFYGRLDDVARELGAGFVRIHQRYLVRAAAVERVESSEVTVAGQVLPMSRSCQSAALLELTRSLLEE